MKEKPKKVLLSLGMIATVVSPVATVIACSKTVEDLTPDDLSGLVDEAAPASDITKDDVIALLGEMGIEVTPEEIVDYLKGIGVEVTTDDVAVKGDDATGTLTVTITYTDENDKQQTSVIKLNGFKVDAGEEKTLYNSQGEVVNAENAIEGENTAEVPGVGDESGLTYTTTEASDDSYYKDEDGMMYTDLPGNAVVGENTAAVGDGSGHTYNEVTTGTYFVDNDDNVYESLPENATADEVQTPAVGDESGLTYTTTEASDDSYYKDEDGMMYTDLPGNAVVGENTAAVAQTGDGSGNTYTKVAVTNDDYYTSSADDEIYDELTDISPSAVEGENTAGGGGATKTGDGSGNTYTKVTVTNDDYYTSSADDEIYDELTDISPSAVEGENTAAVDAVGDGSGHTYNEVTTGTYFVDNDDNVYESLPENATADEVQTPAVGDESGLTYTTTEASGDSYYKDEDGMMYTDLPGNAVVGENTAAVGDESGHTYNEVTTGTYFVDDDDNVYESLPENATADEVQTESVEAVGDGSGETYYAEDPTVEEA